MKIVSAAEVKKRFGRKWRKWDKYLFELYTTEKKLRRILEEEAAFVGLRERLAEDTRLAALDGSPESFRRYVMENLPSPLVSYYVPYTEEIQDSSGRTTFDGGKLTFANGEITFDGEKNLIAAAAVVAIEKFIAEEYLNHLLLFDFGGDGKEELTV